MCQSTLRALASRLQKKRGQTPISPHHPTAIKGLVLRTEFVRGTVIKSHLSAAIRSRRHQGPSLAGRSGVAPEGAWIGGEIVDMTLYGSPQAPAAFLRRATNPSPSSAVAMSGSAAGIGVTTGATAESTPRTSNAQ